MQTVDESSRKCFGLRWVVIFWDFTGRSDSKTRQLCRLRWSDAVAEHAKDHRDDEVMEVSTRARLPHSQRAIRKAEVAKEPFPEIVENGGPSVIERAAVRQ